jgi:hypothetical protein
MGLAVAGQHAFKGAHVTSNLSLSLVCVEPVVAAERGREKEREQERAWREKEDES